MNKDEILKMSREENEGKHDEREMMAYGTASRVGMLVGAIICAVLVFASELLFHIPEIGLVGWLVYFAMQGSGNIVLFKKLKSRRNLIWGIIEIVFVHNRPPLAKFSWHNYIILTPSFLVNRF